MSSVWWLEYGDIVLTVPSHVGQSLDGNGVWRSKLEGRWINSARFSTMASAILSGVGFSPLQEDSSYELNWHIGIERLSYTFEVLELAITPFVKNNWSDSNQHQNE